MIQAILNDFRILFETKRLFFSQAVQFQSLSSIQNFAICRVKLQVRKQDLLS